MSGFAQPFAQPFAQAFVEWFAMGGYGWYVWLSYAAGLLVLAGNVWRPLRYHRRLLKRRTGGGSPGAPP